MFIKKIWLFCVFLFLSFSAYSHPGVYYPYSYPVPSASVYPLCAYGHSSTCYTNYGRSCQLFAGNYHASWFSSCLGSGIFHACLNLPALPVPIVQNTCYLRGTPCVCAFGLYNGYYIYEPGFVL